MCHFVSLVRLFVICWSGVVGLHFFGIIGRACRLGLRVVGTRLGRIFGIRLGLALVLCFIGFGPTLRCLVRSSKFVGLWIRRLLCLFAGLTGWLRITHFYGSTF